MKEAFYYMFKDNMFKKKVLMYFCFAFIANLLIQYGNIFAPANKNAIAPIQYYILNLLGFIVLLIPCGYGVSCLKALMEQNENPVLPFLNIKNSFILGFKLMLGIILLTIIFGIFYVAAAIIFAILSAALKSSALIAGFYIIIPLCCILLIGIYTPVFSCILAKKEWYTTFLRFIRATKLIRLDAKTYFKGVGLFILTAILTSILNSPFNLLLSGTLFAPLISAFAASIFSSYTVFVYAYIFAKTVKHECIE